MSVPPKRPPPPLKGKVFFTQNMVSTMVLLGIVVFFIGTMVSTSTAFLKAPSYSDYSDWDAYEAAQKDYIDSRNNILGTGNLFVEIGGLLSCLGLLGGAIENTQIPISVKCAFISAAIAFIITVLVVLSLISRTGSL
jgi:hypothetical protein